MNDNINPSIREPNEQEINEAVNKLEKDILALKDRLIGYHIKRYHYFILDNSLQTVRKLIHGQVEVQEDTTRCSFCKTTTAPFIAVTEEASICNRCMAQCMESASNQLFGGENG